MAYNHRWSPVRVLELLGRTSDSDADGDGRIARAFYVEPFTAAQYVEAALKGYVNFSGASPNIGTRVKPNQDPLKPNFYCTDVHIDPWEEKSVTGTGPKAYTPPGSFSVSNQFTAINNALNTPDSFDYDAIVDFAHSPPLSPAEILQGYPNYGSESYTAPVQSRGKCGARLIATYSPIHPLNGWPSTDPNYGTAAPDPFDVVDPQLNGIIKSTQLGRDLKVYAPLIYSQGDVGITAPSLTGGLSDTATVPEFLYEFSFRRLMVPFVPTNTFSQLVNRVNQFTIQLGNGLSVPPGCCRIDAPVIETCYNLWPPVAANFASTDVNPQFWYNITLKFSIRIIQADYYDVVSGYTSGRIDWNHQLCLPLFLNAFPANFKGISYYPVGWSTSSFVVPGSTFRPVYLNDKTNASGGALPASTTVPVNQIPAMWLNGFSTND